MVLAGLVSCLASPNIVGVTASALTYQVLALQALFILRFRANRYF
jgi:hypothetical protein